MFLVVLRVRAGWGEGNRPREKEKLDCDRAATKALTNAKERVLEVDGPSGFP